MCSVTEFQISCVFCCGLGIYATTAFDIFIVKLMKIKHLLLNYSKSDAPVLKRLGEVRIEMHLSVMRNVK